MTKTPPRTILIADDDTNFAKFLGELLEQRGFKIVYAADGIGAFTQALKYKPNLVILDYTMPAASGGTVYQRFINSKETMNIPIIFLSSLSMKELEARIPRAPGIRLLTKPVKFEILKTHIEELLSQPPPSPPKPPPANPPPTNPPPINPNLS